VAATSVSLIVRILDCRLIALAPAILAAQSATLPRLERGKAIDRTLSAGATDTYALVLRAGDLVSLKVSDKGKDVIVSVFGPAGTRERAFSLRCKTASRSRSSPSRPDRTD
jgi:hypothetical protein